jgi:CRISPR system Cascade subunit CasA
MTSYSFNLIDREWIWGVWNEDSRCELISLYTALAHAHELREIHGDTPPETAALYRLLLTMLYGIYNPDENEEWGNLWEAGLFDRSIIDANLHSEQLFFRFDLYDSERPFFQLAQDAPAWTKYKLISVSNLRAHYASGNDAVLFDHRLKNSGIGTEVNNEEGGTILSSAEAARALVTQQSFGFAGLNDPGAANIADKSFSDAPCARHIIFLMEGKTLFETLMLNFFSLDLPSHGLPHTPDDRPAWALGDPFRNDAKRPYGYLDYATWLNRKILLIPEGNPDHPIVRRMRYYVGMKRMNGQRLNPLMSLRPNPKAGKTIKDSEVESSSHLPLAFSKERALWRDSASLFGWFQERQQGYLAPQAFEWAHNELPIIYKDIAQDRKFFFSAYGICSNPGKDKMYSFRAEHFPLPPAYLQEAGADAAKQLKLALERAESAARILSVYGALGDFACAVLGIKPENKKKPGYRERVDNLVKATGAERYFWSRMELQFTRLVEDLPEHPLEAVQAWDKALKELARQAFEEATKVVGGVSALQAYGIASNWFEFQLKCVFEPLPGIQKGKVKNKEALHE